MELLIRRLAAALLIVSGAGLAAGCATTEVSVQWTDPQFAGRSLRGEQLQGEHSAHRRCERARDVDWHDHDAPIG